MKAMFLKGCVLLALCTYSSFSQAQIGKGKILLNGSGSIYSNSQSSQDSLSNFKSTNASYSFSPSLGVFVSNKVCIGMAIPLTYQQSVSNTSTPITDYVYSSRSSTITYGVSPYVRYYMNFTEKFYGYLNANVGVAMVEIESTTSGAVPPKGTRLNYNYSSGLNFGLTYFVTPKLALETSLVGVTYMSKHSKLKGVSYENYRNDNSVSVNYFPSGINLGVSFYLR